MGKRVLLIDCDAQGNLQNQFHVRTEKTLVDLLLHGEVEIASVRKNLDLINSGKQKLAEAEVSLAGNPFREMIMTEKLKQITDYDYIFCDLSPTITPVNTMALYYCRYLLIPISMSFFAITGALQIIESSEIVNQHRHIELLGLIMNFVDSRTNMTKMISEAVREKWSSKVFDSVIRKNIAIEEAPSQHKTIYEHAPQSNGALDFTRLTEEFLQRCPE